MGKRMAPWRVSGLLPGLLLLAAAPGHAQLLPDAIQACRGETDNRLRLECYDREVAKYPLTTAQGFGLDARQVREAQQRLAAATAAGAAPAAAAHGAAGTAAAAGAAGALPSTRALTAKVQAVTVRPDGLYVLTLDSGQTWAETERNGAERAAVGDTVRIDPGLFGSFFLVDQASHWAAKVRRLK